MRYFITGATGFIGGEVTRQLREAGHDVIALVRSPKKAGKLKELGVEIAPGDITDKASLRAPMTGVDGIFHWPPGTKWASGTAAWPSASTSKAPATCWT